MGRRFGPEQYTRATTVHACPGGYEGHGQSSSDTVERIISKSARDENQVSVGCPVRAENSC